MAALWPSPRAGLRAGVRRRLPPTLALILAAAALQSLAWDVALPAFQGPDESAHFAYVQHLAETGSIPSISSGRAPVSGEQAAVLKTLNLHALIGNVSARPAWSSADLALLDHVESQLPAGSRANGHGPNYLARNPPLYYALMAIPYRAFVWLPLLQRLFVLRLFNAVFFWATVALTWMLAGELFRSRWKQALAAGVVALEPQLAFMSAVVNADNLLIALSTAVLLACVRLVLRGPTTHRVLLAGALTGAAMLTHGRGLATVPVLAVALTISWIRFRPARRAAAQSAALAGGCVIFALAVEYGLASGGGGSLYQGQVSSLNSGGFKLGEFLAFGFHFLFWRLTSLRAQLDPGYGYRQVFITTFYGTFGSLEVSFRPAVYNALQVLSGVGLAGFFTACAVRWRRLARAWAPVAVLSTAAVTLIVFLLYVSYRALMTDGGSDPLIVGRYLLPIVSLFGLAIAFTLGSLPRRAGSLWPAACGRGNPGR